MNYKPYNRLCWRFKEGRRTYKYENFKMNNHQSWVRPTSERGYNFIKRSRVGWWSA